MKTMTGNACELVSRGDELLGIDFTGGLANSGMSRSDHDDRSVSRVGEIKIRTLRR